MLTCFFFGEGKDERRFLERLVDLPEFLAETIGWDVTKIEGGHEKGEIGGKNKGGGCPRRVMEECRRLLVGRDYGLVVCFVDLDKLKDDYKDRWESEKQSLEAEFNDIIIFWQFDKLEHEISKVFSEIDRGHKKELNRVAYQHPDKFVGGTYWNRLLKEFKIREEQIRARDVVQK